MPIKRALSALAERAQQAAPGASPLERALIQAMAVRYGRAPGRDQKVFEAQGASLCGAAKPAKNTDPQDLGYAAAMADVLRQFPNDPDVVTLYADAVMVLTPWEWWDPKTGRPNGKNGKNGKNGSVADAAQRLAAITQQHPQHTGALHFYVHIYVHISEHAPGRSGSRRFGHRGAGGAHLVHMGSHIYKNIGRFDAGSLANQQALGVQKRFDAILQAQGAGGRGRWDAHHLHFLWFAALMEGHVDLSLGTAREYARRFGNQGDGAGEYARLLPLATLVRLGQWDAVLAGCLARTEGRPEQALAGLREAADLDDGFGNDPALIGGGVRLALAGALMEAGKLEEAAKELAEAQRLNGPNAWVHQGLSALAGKRGAPGEAQRQAELSRTAWRNAQGASLPGI